MDLVRGRVRAEGISLTASELPNEEIFFRMLHFGEWDMAEFAMAKYASLAAAGEPAFPCHPGLSVAQLFVSRASTSRPVPASWSPPIWPDAA